MTHQNDNREKPEFSRVVTVADIPTGEGGGTLALDFAASPNELTALGTRLGLDSLDALDGHADLTLLPSGDVALEMRFTARVRQTCVITLQPVESEISHEFTTTYSEEEAEDWGHDEEEFEDVDETIEPPEPLIDGKIDVGEACVEQLALEVDPFPRVKGASFEGFTSGSGSGNEARPEKENPFAVLSKLKTHGQNDD